MIPLLCFFSPWKPPAVNSDRDSLFPATSTVNNHERIVICTMHSNRGHVNSVWNSALCAKITRAQLLQWTGSVVRCCCASKVRWETLVACLAYRGAIFVISNMRGLVLLFRSKKMPNELKKTP